MFADYESHLILANHKLHLSLAGCEDRRRHLHLLLLPIFSKNVACQRVESPLAVPSRV